MVSLDDLPDEILFMIWEPLLVRDLPITTRYLTQEEEMKGSGGRWPLPYAATSISRSDLAPLATCKRLRWSALYVFWSKNVFLYCPRSVTDRRLASRFVTRQSPSTLQYLHRIEVNLFVKSVHMGRWDEELTGRLLPLDNCFKRLPQTHRLTIQVSMYKSGEPEWQWTCRSALQWGFVAFTLRAAWRLKRVQRKTRIKVADWNEHVNQCHKHRCNPYEEDPRCGWWS